jgi:hypothetical protein
MLYIDSVILNMIEGACRRFQRLTGRTNVWLAVQMTNLSIILYFLWAAAAFWTADAQLRILVGVFCAGLMYVLLKTLFRESIEAYENSMRNPRRVRDALLRVSFLTLAVVFGYAGVVVYMSLHLQILLLTLPLIFLTTAVLYLLACDPLPPSAGRLREKHRAPATVRTDPAAS